MMKSKNSILYVAVAFFGFTILACSSAKVKVASADSSKKVIVSPAAPPKLALVALDEKGQIIQIDEKVKEKNLRNRLASLTDTALKGKDIFETRCAECHDLPEPQKFKKLRWPVILESMKVKAQLDDAAFASVKEYTDLYFID